MKCLVVLLAAHAAFAQEGPRVQGVVVGAISQEPIGNAIVVLHSRDTVKGISYETESGGGGKFSIEHVNPGSYTVTVSRQLFTTVENEPSRQLTVEKGKEATLVLKLVPLCAIAGRVLDEDGDPVREATVQAMRYGYVAGKRQLMSGVTVMTDDRGDYRLFGILAGKIYVQVASVHQALLTRVGPITSHPPLAYVRTYFPGATDFSAATAINVAPGGEARGIDITIRRERVYSVRGPLPPATPDSSGRPGEVPGYLVRLVPRGTGNPRIADVSSGAKVQNGSTATFAFVNVRPGSYTLVATTTEDSRRSYAREPVNVGSEDVDNIKLVFTPGKDVSGSVTFQDKSQAVFQNMRVLLATAFPNEGSAPLAEVDSGGNFLLHNVPPDRLELLVVGGGTSYLKSVRIGDRAAADRHIDFAQGVTKLTVVLASDFGDVEGAVKGAADEPVSGVRVTAIPSGSNTDRVDLSRFAFTDEKGNFYIKDIAPGGYKLFAWDKVQVGAPQDPDFRKPYEKQGKEIQLASLGHESVELTLIHVMEQ